MLTAWVMTTQSPGSGPLSDNCSSQVSRRVSHPASLRCQRRLRFRCRVRGARLAGDVMVQDGVAGRPVLLRPQRAGAAQLVLRLLHLSLLRAQLRLASVQRRRALRIVLLRAQGGAQGEGSPASFVILDLQRSDPRCAQLLRLAPVQRSCALLHGPAARTGPGSMRRAHAARGLRLQRRRLARCPLTL